jgi:hypothetical protein
MTKKTMTNFDLYKYYQKMVENGIILTFQGAISQELLVGMAEMLKNKFAMESIHSKNVKKIFSVFIELAQNIARYSADKVKLENYAEEVGAGIIIVNQQETYYTISSGNLVSKNEVEEIISHCDNINSKNIDELKQLYKDHIKLPRSEGKHGGGIGLIDIARKSSNPIRYKVTDVNADYSFLVLTTRIEEG